MGFTVTRPGGTKDAEFQAYARLLRQSGVDLGKLPRVSDPQTRRRWLYVWDAQADARAFVKELKRRTADASWEVVEVNGKVSVGPLGPIVIQLARQSTGLTFGLHPLSRATIRSAFPQAIGATYITIDPQAWDEFRQGGNDLAALMRKITPTLTGLSDEELNTLGYAVVDDDTQETLVLVPPATADGC